MVNVVKPQLQDHLSQFENVTNDLEGSLQSLYELLSTIEPLLISEIMQNLKQTTLLLFNATHDEDVPDTTVDAELKVCNVNYLVDDNNNAKYGSTYPITRISGSYFYLAVWKILLLLPN